jgi:N-acetylneuraminic acid mutarotase
MASNNQGRNFYYGSVPGAQDSIFDERKGNVIMTKTNLLKTVRRKCAWKSGVLAFSIFALISACVLKEKQEPESTYGWTWESGSDLAAQAGVYGTKGTASSSNVPGARGYALSWFDSSGKLWLFGGHAYDSAGISNEINDMWKYNPTTLEWTWVSGSNTINQTGSYGTRGTADASNVPGGRYGAISWLDSSGKLWLFGGWGLDSAGASGDLNDLWKFDPTTLEWTWVSGSDTALQAGVYGTQGTADPSNFPGARDKPTSWLDSSGKLWLFGGVGYDLAGNLGQLSDLWTYNPTTFQWTWVSGSNTINQSGIYGTQGTASPSNAPGGNCGAIPWLDSNGKLWLFGGSGYDSSGNLGALNDLWKYDPTTHEWTWVDGSKTANQLGDYGTRGRRVLSNAPGGREDSVSWLDSSGKLWFFGGRGFASRGAENYLNDLWSYTR